MGKTMAYCITFKESQGKLVIYPMTGNNSHLHETCTKTEWKLTCFHFVQSGSVNYCDLRNNKKKEGKTTK
jgi:hypothetical protein